MDQYLQQILREVNTIILPGLGALTVTDKTSGEMMFMGFLKHDDGNFSKFISEKDGIDENDAKNKIAKYVRDIQAVLDKGESYDIYQFGRFIKVKDEIEFQSWNTYQNTASATAPIEKETPIVEMKPTPVVEKPVVAEPITEKPKAVEPKIETPKTEKAEENPKAEEKKEVKATVVPESVIIPKDQNVYIPADRMGNVKHEEEVVKKTVPQEKAKAKEKPVKKVKEPKEKKKRSPLFWILVVLGIIVILGGTGSIIFMDQVKAFFNGEQIHLAKEGETELEEDEPVDNTAEIEAAGQEESMDPTTDDANASEIQEEKTPEPAKIEESKQAQNKPAPQVDNGLPFHIIVGGFLEISNATRLAEKLQAEGKNSQVIGQFDDLHLVSYASYANQEEAQSALKSIEMSGWVFKYSSK